MNAMTEGNLKAAFAGESQAHMKYLNFADKAEKEGLANVARLFQAASYAEQIHASNHLKALDGIQSTAASASNHRPRVSLPMSTETSRKRARDKATARWGPKL